MGKPAKEPEMLPWEQQPGESPKAFEAFNRYLLMGTERSLQKVAFELDKSTNMMGKWSSRWKWVERVAAWDIEQERQARNEQAEEIRKMRKRHASIATSMLAKVSKRMQQMQAEELTPQDIKAWVEAASKLERLSRGDSSEIVEERDGGKAIDPVQIYLPDNGRDEAEEEEDEDGDAE